ncbi:AAA family ATPase [Lewinellaceae bacterium SD302]|nr:AAA family ATPase [Lewinellaceae bacterium SD302]
MQAATAEKIQHLRDLVQLEREEERRMHLEVIQRLPLVQRIAKGYSWYPISVVKFGHGIGERPFILIERSGEEEHQFRAGTSVNLFTQQAHAHRPQVSGVIQFVKRNRMKIILSGQDIPDWVGSGQTGVDLMFDERTYREMDRALVALQETEDDRVQELRDKLFGARKITGGYQVDGLNLPDHLNDSQRAAVREIVSNEDLVLVHGPPGTGKTTTLIAAVQQLVQTESTVLFAAPSNTAADLVAIRLAKLGIVVTRTGNISRVNDEVLEHTLEMQLAQHPDTREIKKMRREAAQLRSSAKQWKRGPGGGQKRGLMFRDAGLLSKMATQLEDRLLHHVLDRSQVIVCTLVGAASSVLAGREFRTCIIDEAAQALEPACWIPILKSSRVVLAGDPFQLPPTVKSREAEKKGFGVTLMEHCLSRLGDQARLLEVQYRMNEKIMGYSNLHFYDGRLQAAESVAGQTLINHSLPESLVFIDTAGAGFDEQLQQRFQSRYNEQEISIAQEHLYELIGSIPPEEPLPSIAVISPYREQVLRAQDIIEEDEKIKALDITVNTIDGFQGQERELVYISLVRSNEKGEIGFLKDYRRMNVALTRARKQLVVIGDSATIATDKFYAGFIDYVEKEGSYRTVWEFMR